MSGPPVAAGGDPIAIRAGDGGRDGAPSAASAPGAPRDAATRRALRARILDDPDLVLGDPLLMRALVARAERGRARTSGKVVDLRAVAMERLEARLDRLESAHRTVIAAAYENLAGTQQVHRAILRLLDAEGLEAFLDGLSGEVAMILRLSAVRLLVEGAEPWPPAPGAAPSAPAGGEGPAPPPPEAASEAAPDPAPEAVLRIVAPGAIARDARPGAGPSALVSLHRGARLLEGAAIASEAWLALDLGSGRLPGLLVLGSSDPEQFAPGQGTELLEFLAGVFERALRRWL